MGPLFLHHHVEPVMWHEPVELRTILLSDLSDPEVVDLLPQHLHTLLPRHVVLGHQHVSCPPSLEVKVLAEDS